MTHTKISHIVFSLIVFALSGMMLLLGFFDLGQSILIKNPVDYSFFIIVNIAFWYTAAFLFNQLINSFILDKFIKTPIGLTSRLWVRDFISAIPYTISTGIIISTSFFIEIKGIWILILLLFLFIFTLARSKIISGFSSQMFSRVKPFNEGDWVSIKNKSGKLLVTGEVYSINRNSVLIKNENNNLIFLSSESLSEMIIENFWSFVNHSRFDVEFCVDNSIPVDRVKRILQAGTKQAIEEKGLLKVPEPQVKVKTINEYGIIYEVSYWIKPWIDISPSEAKDKIISIILSHLDKSGISLAIPKHDIYMTEMPQRFTDLSKQKDRIQIISKVDLLNVLNQSEMEIIAEGLIAATYKRGEAIVREGESGDSMFILVEGLLNVYILNNNGDEILVAKIKPGEFFGEMSLLTGDKRSAAVVAHSDSLVFTLNKEMIAPIIQNRPLLVEEFGKIITQRHKINLEKLLESGKKEVSILELIVGKIKSFFNLKG